MRQLCLSLFFLATQPCYSHDLLTGHHQLLVVTTRDWEKKQGDLQLYERCGDDAAWISVGASLPVVVGNGGLAWGIGLHPAMQMPPRKIEGDGKSPAGVFSLGSAFGFAPRMDHLKIAYLPLDPSIEAVDDPQSRYYNQVVSRRDVAPDWQSSEKMRGEALYELGCIVHHNFPHPQPGAGSAIFLHIWRREDSGTAGCTAMSREHLAHILSWLDRMKNPVLVQLPISAYRELQSEWHLPKLAHNLVNLAEVSPDIVLDIRYATSDNFLGFPIYSKPVCYVHREVAEALLQVQQELVSMQLGLKVFDGYRPLSAQQKMWDAVQDERYVANPAKNKGCHTRGTAVDLTLVDCQGNELEMPTKFDDFTERAHRDYADVSEAASKNRALLEEVMKKHHFQPLHTEWWHFDFQGWRDDVKFPPLDLILP